MQVLTEIDDFPGFGFTPLTQSCSAKMDTRIAEAVRLTEKVGGNKVGFIGLACGSSTDGSCESPILKVMKCLADNGREVAAFDPAIYPLGDLASFGPRGSLRASADEIIDWCETLVVTHHSRTLQAAIAARRGRCLLIDLVDLFVEQIRPPANADCVIRCRLSQKIH